MSGIVVFSFALRSEEEEPNPCNKRLALAAERVIASQGSGATVVAQWEVARKLEPDGYALNHVVNLPADGSYLDSEGVWAEAREVFRQNGVKIVYPIAQPFLQMTKVRKMIEKDGFTVMKSKIGIAEIGFDKESTQWWTRGSVRLFTYGVLQLRYGLWGNKGRQVA